MIRGYPKFPFSELSIKVLIKQQKIGGSLIKEINIFDRVIISWNEQRIERVVAQII